MSKRTKSSLESENAELRARVKMLEDVVQKLVAQPAVQSVPMPCPGPHYPAPTVNPYPVPVYPQWPLDGSTTICGDPMVGQTATITASKFLGTEPIEWNSNGQRIGTH